MRSIALKLKKGNSKMKIENNKDHINITFLCYAKDSLDCPSNLVDKENCVEIYYNFNDWDGWGSVTGEYFLTRDIKALAEGFSKILYGTEASLKHVGPFPFKGVTDPFYTFQVNRQEDEVTVSLEIHDSLCDYVTVTETMDLSKFEEITKEFKEAARKYPVK